MIFPRRFLAAGLLGVVAAMLVGMPDANAQQIFRIVGPDGRLTFSDKPPLEIGPNARMAPVVALPGPGPAAAANLPFELRQVAVRFPVTLYTAPACAPCAAGRTMLSARGIPFGERTVTSNEDIEALKRLSSGAPSLPFLTIGGQQLKGYSEAEWNEFLDAAGYPKTSQLPSGYVRAPAVPLVSAEAPQQAVAPLRPAPASPGSPAEPAPPNPAGIRF